MATVKRVPYQHLRSANLAIRGEVNTADAGDGRPAVLILLGAERKEGISVPLLERLARAGLTAISAAIVPDWTAENLEEAADAVSEFAADLLAGRHPGLAPPRALGIFGERRQRLLAIAVAAREPRVAYLVTWDPEDPEPVEEERLAALSAKVQGRWLEMGWAKKSALRRRGRENGLGASKVLRLANEAQAMDAAVAWFVGMLS